jgi:hypothetical protein
MSNLFTQVSYFEQVKSRGTGTTRPLAVILSLPLSLMLWGMFWFIFAIISCAYSTGIPGISRQYSVATRSLCLTFFSALSLAGIAVIRFFHGIWKAPTVAEQQSTQNQPTAVDMVTGQGGNPLMQLSGDQHLGSGSYAYPVQAGRLGSAVPTNISRLPAHSPQAPLTGPVSAVQHPFSMNATPLVVLGATHSRAPTLPTPQGSLPGYV